MHIGDNSNRDETVEKLMYPWMKFGCDEISEIMTQLVNPKATMNYCD